MFKTLEIASLAIIAVFAPIQAVVCTVAVLVLCDLLTGVLASYRRGESITSTGFKRSVGKIFLYEVGLLMAFLVQTYLTGDILPATKLVSSLIGLTELKSILENLDSVSGGSLYSSIIQRIAQSQSPPKGP